MKPFPAAAKAAASVTGALILSGAFALWLLNRPATDTLVELVPQDVSAYVHVFLRPSTQEQLDIESLMRRLGSEDAAGDVAGAIEEIVEPFLRGSGLTFDEDVRPWVGSQVGWFTTDDGKDQALLIHVKDVPAATGALRRFLVSRPASDSAILDDVVAVGTPGAIARLRDPLAEGHHLDDQQSFADILGPLPGHRVAAAFLRTDDGVIGASLSVRADGVQWDAIGPEGDSLLRSVLEAPAGAPDLAQPLPAWGRVALDVLDPGAIGAALGLTALSRPSDEAAGILGDGIEPRVEIDTARALAMAEPLGLLDSQAKATLPSWLDRIGRVIAGHSEDGGYRHERIFIGVK